MSTYAASTNVSTQRSRDEIERTLRRYGADQFVYGWSREQAMIGFMAHRRNIRFVLPLPDSQDAEFTRTPTGRRRTSAQAKTAHEQAVRQRWRALALVIKAKLEAVDAGIVTFEEEFLAQTLLPNGRTVAEQTAPTIEQAYATGAVPPMLALEAGS